MKVAIITGTRSNDVRDDPAALGRLLTAIEWADFVVLGDCPTGIDAAARHFCEVSEVWCEVLRADWGVHGRGAGPRRNGEMVRTAIEAAEERGGVVRCFAFPYVGSRGTWDCLKQAAERGIRGYVWPVMVDMASA